ncbi:DNA mismatch repair protein MutS2 [Eubacterium ruminantium]|nr:DNA mismatch repair protein MutS2 [Eubacterium ruminantium]
MNKRTLRILEYNKILSMLAEYAASPMAKKRAERLTPYRDIERIRTLQEETRDACLRISKNGNLSFSGLTDVGASLKLLAINSPLSASELLGIAAMLETAKNAKAYGEMKSDAEEVINDSLVQYFSFLNCFPEISSEIKRCIISADEIADDASRKLKEIRKNIEISYGRIRQKLEKIIHSEAAKDYLQEALITTRSGRYCIPVKASYRTKFPGMIHDQSSTGSTLFIEPLEVVNLNNDIRELENEEHIEIERILMTLSELCAARVEELTECFKLLTDLDFIFAKAKFSYSYRGSEPILNEEGIIDLKSAIHPLLERSTAVPIDLRLGEDCTLLIVTGPNTGGKTVSLKTLGLLTLMAQSGLHIPARYGTKIAVYNDIFADIGDEQSIEQNLSTFSSHMSNIVYIVEHTDSNCLCLFDEPGGGTDPVEGAALATAILSDLMEKGATVMATTHYSELKTFAIATPGVENASCEFDIATLQPTYKLQMGVPGKSNAFAISKKLGLPEYIIERARSGIDKDVINAEELIADLDKAKREAEEHKKEIEESHKEIEILKKRLSEKEKAADEEKRRIIEKAREEAREILENAKEEADSAIRDYNKWLKDPSRADAKKMEQLRTNLREKAGKMASKNTFSKNSSLTGGHKSSDFHLGDTVKVISLDTEGHILELPDNKGMALVGMGILSSRLPISDLMIINDATEEHKYSKKAGNSGFNKSYSFKPEINLLGKTVDEAVAELDKFLDDAMLSHAESVRVVHGKGTGALRKGIHDHLKRLSYVKSFRLGEFGEGDAGVTIVNL